MPKQNPSGRALGHLMLTYGLMNIPVSLYTGTVSDHGINRRQFVTVTNEDGSTEDHPVGNRPYDKETGENVESGDVIKKIGTEYGDVYVEDGEIEELLNVKANSLEIKGFQPIHLFHQGHYVPKSLYFVEPSKGAGKGGKKVDSLPNQKALTSILKAMREEGVLCVCELTTRGVPKPAILLPDGTLWQVYHTDALREQRPLPEVELHPDEVQMARTLVQTLLTTEPMDLTDERSALIQNFADEKAQAGDFGKPEDVAPKEPKANVDLMAALAASVEQAKAKQQAV